jgi:NAD(P)-dependent dehydrogenase (short-subunit alcohol dehydrogenase family)
MVKEDAKYAAAKVFSLEGKKVLLTGASGFLGRTFSRALLDNGADVALLGRSEKLSTGVDQWRAEYGASRVHGFRVDMYDRAALGRAVDDALAALGRIDVLVNNAHELGPATGFNVPDGGLDGATFEHWSRNFEGGLFWPAFLTQRLGPGMRERRSGSIVNIATMYSVVAPSPRLYEGTRFMNPPGYSASKAALLALTRYTASFWGPDGVRANAISPGPFSNTEDVSANAVDPNDEFIGRLRARTCLSRIGRPDELVGALLFLASDASTFVTGQNILVDGGWTVT